MFRKLYYLLQTCKLFCYIKFFYYINVFIFIVIKIKYIN